MKKNTQNHTMLSFFLIWEAIIVQSIIYARNYADAWGPFLLRQVIMGIVGYFGYQLINSNPVFPTTRKDFAGLTDGDAIVMLVGFVIYMFVQLVMNSFMKYSISVTEEVLYYANAPAVEEIMFRGFVLGIFLRPKIKNKNARFALATVGNFIQAYLWFLIHTQYYGNWNSFFTVFLVGLGIGFLAIGFKFSKGNIKITGLMLAHFWANLLAVGVWWVTLGL